jgi:hypothetical protein
MFSIQIHKIKHTKRTFQRRSKSLRIGNGGDGALQKEQIAVNSVFANSSSLSFG